MFPELPEFYKDQDLEINSINKSFTQMRAIRVREDIRLREAWTAGRIGLFGDMPTTYFLNQR